ncbi:hypothetical protein E0K93_20890 [Puniceibacterium sp. HSS470]|uniref:hypothetical protein n=1 Tax=Pseudooceanicola sediminis TaxID=2211117 RepID=UPI0011C35B5D|nr:hypothetical protein [Pseudooceanicola sediminis]KAA2311346.1 hypothetical protein E0K93_20890 [Puniceibacterium sp. HSS470]|tara:strand:+ start:704 stop:1033 length:330 start_codon:yes stop_codon:yes gene_type:complete
MNDDDPARKYIPTSKKINNENGSSSEINHGAFTNIAYGTAWSVGVLGSLIGAFFIWSSFEGIRIGYSNQINANIFSVGCAIIVGSWISASGVGTLAEISRKLTERKLAK